MQILVDRYLSDAEATLSKVSVDGAFVCHGLEDEHRRIKVFGETRIPAGEYDITVRREGGFHKRYSNDRRFRDFHQGMLWVRRVPGFRFILIHVGNTEKHTKGCLLVGNADERKMCVWNSARAYETLYKRVINHADVGDLTIRYMDNDR